MIRTLLAPTVLLAGLGLAAHNLSSAPPKSNAVTLATLDGKPTTLDAVKGKTATVVVFVSFECPVSASYVAPLGELAKEYAEKGVAVIGVCPTDDPVDAVKKAADGFRPAFPVLLDPKKELAASLKAEVTPEVFVLDASGEVRYRGRIDDRYAARTKPNASVKSHDLKDALEDLLAGKAVRTPVTKAIGCAIEFDVAPMARAGAVTYHKDVAPILQKHCQTCHRPGEVGPFPLMNYKQARRWAEDIAAYTGARQMPPWMPGGGLPMKGERKMTDAEIATLAAWADAGAPEGDPKDGPPPVVYPDGWRNGKPDLILTPSEEFHLAPSGNDLFRCFVLPTGLTEDKWVVGYDVKPGNPRVVHHTLHFYDTSGQGRELEQKQQLKDKELLPPDRGPGYTSSMGVGFTGRAPKKGEPPTLGGIGGWAPGQGPQFVPQGAGWLLPKGADFIIQTHYHRDGQPGIDRTQVGLYFAKAPVDQPWQTIVAAGLRGDEKIPAGKPDHHSRGEVYLHTDAIIHNVLPHMHLLGKSVKVTMTPPGGQPVVLVDIPAWDYRWQETYWFQEPVLAKRGTKLEIEAVFDNSEKNPNNPRRPPVDVKFGEQTTDEMLFGFLGMTSTKTPYEKIKRYGFPPAELGAAGAPAQGEMTPVLERRLGAWDNAVVVKPVLGKESKVAATDTVEKAFGGTFIQIRTLSENDGNETIELATFDPAKKAYRMWTYNSQGGVIEWTGTWDEKDTTMSWTASIQGDITGVMKWKFMGNDRLEMELVAKNNGLPVLTLTGTITRKK
ncbi:MAG TPA: redoxin family protein [Gemmataceae bacterium]|nr:redoxin family protein [Gemmataceae bacterium]